MVRILKRCAKKKLKNKRDESIVCSVDIQITKMTHYHTAPKPLVERTRAYLLTQGTIGPSTLPRTLGELLYVVPRFPGDVAYLELEIRPLLGTSPMVKDIDGATRK